MSPDYDYSVLRFVLSLLSLFIYAVLLAVAVFRAGEDRRWLLVVLLLPIVVAIHRFAPTDIPPDKWTWSKILMAGLVLTLLLLLFRPKRR